ncbi:MAG: oligosaccharide flippase family protein [Candidatus Roizmanbacteria bacterium]|nr:MAG: oligosaccharide flippase family protein [Candidatus Roizmanbacteria bacterium]
MHTIEKFLHSVIWFSLGLVLHRIKYILLSLIVFQLGTTNVAIFYISIYLMTEFSSFANRLTSSSYNRFLRDKRFSFDKEHLNAVINSTLQLSLILGLINALMIFFLADPIANLIKNSSFSQTIKLMSLAVPFLVVTNQVIQILSLLTKYKEAVIFHNIIESLLVLSFAGIALTFFKPSIYTILSWQIAAIIISFIIALGLLYRSLPSFKLNLTLLAIPIRISSVIFLNSTFILLLNHIDIFIVGALFGSKQLGSYIGLLVAPHLIYAIATNVFGMFIHTADSFFADTKKVTVFSRKVIESILILASLLTLFLLLFPQETLQNILRLHIRIEPLTLKLLSLSFFIRIIAWMAGQILIVTKHSDKNMQINVFISLIAAPLFIFFIPKYGFFGASLSFLLISLCDVLLKTLFVYTKTSVSFISVKAIKILLIGLFFYIINGLVPVNFNFFVIYFPFLFIAVLFLLKGIELEDFILLKHKLNKKNNAE